MCKPLIKVVFYPSVYVEWIVLVAASSMELDWERALQLQGHSGDVLCGVIALCSFVFSTHY